MPQAATIKSLWQRGKSGTGQACSSPADQRARRRSAAEQQFGANAAWFRLNLLLRNLLSAFKRVALPPDLHAARPSGGAWSSSMASARGVRHARETVLGLVGEARRRLADGARLALTTGPPLRAAA